MPPLDKCQKPTLVHDYLLSQRHRKTIVGSRVPVMVYWLNEDYLAIDWLLVDHEVTPFGETTLTKFFLVEMPFANSIGGGIRWPEARVTVLLNTLHPFVKWLERIKLACQEGDQGVSQAQLNMLFDLMDNPFRYISDPRSLQEYLEAWSNLPNLTQDLYPPDVRLTEEAFRLPYC